MSSFQKLTVKELKVMKITPKMAEEFLKNNKINRNIRPGLVNKYATILAKNKKIGSYRKDTIIKYYNIAKKEIQLLAKD